MNQNELFKDVNLTDLPENYQPVAKLIGIDNFVKLCQYAMGDELYFPKPESIFRKTRNRSIIREYNGHNIAELSQKHNITQNTVRKVIKGSKLP